jgi:hypothetical protein
MVDIRDAAVVLRNGGLRQVLQCQPVQVALKDEEEQAAVQDAWTELLHGLTHPIQIVVEVRPAEERDLVGHLPTDLPPALAGMAASYRALITALCATAELVQRDFFVVVPWEVPVLRRKRRDAEQDVTRLHERARAVAQGLNRTGVQTRVLHDDQLRQTLYQRLNPALARRQPLGPAELARPDLRDLLAPAAFAKSRDAFGTGERLTRTLAVTGYPRYLHLDWLEVFWSLRSAARIALFVSPVATELAMPFLEKKIAELASSLRLTAERSGRVDVERRAALEDAQALQVRLARAEERFFDLALYVTLESEEGETLEREVARLETALGGLLIRSRRTLFQMEQGYWSTLPLALDQLNIRRNTTTAGLRVTFPFSASDYTRPDGTLYGLEPKTGAPIFLDRFALPNANAVVLAQSGGGKSYAVKVEILRSLLRGIDVVVLDPEGEYVALAQATGGTVESIAMSSTQLPSAFALGGAHLPGGCTERQLALMTLFRLLIPELPSVEAVALQEALGRIYAFKGLTDDPGSYALAPPNAADLLATLTYQMRPGPEQDIAVALERRVRGLLEGPSGWLLQGTQIAPLPSTGLAVIALARLPEEVRSPAMYLVLERLWQHLRQRQPRRRTLLVIDEAWWLVRHADTARFVFRLAKTARKLDVGLTVITQDVLDLLGSEAGKTVIANAAIQLLFRQAPQAIPELTQCFGLTRPERTLLLNAPVGEGILIGRNSRTPIRVVASAEEDRLART